MPFLYGMLFYLHTVILLLLFISDTGWFPKFEFSVANIWFNFSLGVQYKGAVVGGGATASLLFFSVIALPIRDSMRKRVENYITHLKQELERLVEIDERSNGWCEE
jgi:hypothetical protein